MMKFPRTVAAAVAVVMLVGSTSAKARAEQTPAGQSSQAPAAPATQQQINEEMLKELKAIRLLLERLTTPQGQPPQPQTAKVTNLKGYALGRPDAPLTMVEFTDLQCPFCRRVILAGQLRFAQQEVSAGGKLIGGSGALSYHLKRPISLLQQVDNARPLTDPGASSRLAYDCLQPAS
jgi:hypothetical protein